MERPLVSARLVLCFISVITLELVNGTLPEMRIIANLSQSFFNPRPDITTVTDVQAKCGTSVDSSTNKYFLYCVARDSSTSISSFNLFRTYPDSMNETQKSQVLLDELNPQGVPIKTVYINYEPAVQRLVLIFKEHGGVYLTLNGNQPPSKTVFLNQTFKPASTTEYTLSRSLEQCVPAQNNPTANFIYCYSSDGKLIKINRSTGTCEEILVTGVTQIIKLALDGENQRLMLHCTEGFIFFSVSDYALPGELFRQGVDRNFGPNTDGYTLPQWNYNPQNSTQMLAYCEKGTGTRGFCVVDYGQANATNKLKVTHSLFDIPNITLKQVLIFETIGYVGLVNKTHVILINYDSKGLNTQTTRINQTINITLNSGLTFEEPLFFFMQKSTIMNGPQEFYFTLLNKGGYLTSLKLSFDHCKLRTETHCEAKNCFKGYYPSIESQTATNNTCIKNGFSIEESNNRISVRTCRVENCTRCAQHLDFCTSCNPGTYLVNRECLKDSDMASIHAVGKNLLTQRYENCHDPHCEKCLQNCKVCEKCLAANPERYLQTIGDTIVCSIPREFPAGYGLDIANNKMASCSDDNCLDCYEDHKKCRLCKSERILHPTDGTCLPLNRVPNRFGLKLKEMTGNNTLLPCHDSRCQTCAQYYLNCSSCEASFTLQLNNYTSLNECQHYPFCNESKAEENTCRPVECNITKLEVMMNNKTCKLATELISKLVYSHPKEEFRIILTDWNSETIKIEPFATDFIQLHQIDPFIQNDPGYQLIYNKDYRLAFDETDGVKYLRVEFLTQKTETSQLVRMKMAPISFRRIISQRRLVEVQAEPFSVTDVGVKTLNNSSSEEKFLKFMGDFGVLAILTFVPFLCFCWRNMQVAIYSLQMLSSVHIWNMLAGPSTNSMQIIPENHKIYKMVLFVQSLSDNSSCRISGLWSGHSEDFLLIRNVNCSVSYSILIIVGGVFVIFAVLALVMQCFGKNTFEWKTEIEYNEWKFNRRNQRYLSTVSVAYGVWKGLEPASLLYSGVLLSHNYLLFSSYALILIFVIMFAVGLYCGIQLYTRFKTAKVDPADRTYQDAVGSTDEVLGVLNQFGMFHWMDDSPLNKNILVYLEPTITSLRNILLVVFVFVFHKNSVAQHYWILGLMGVFTLLEFYLIYQSFDKGRPVRMASRILLIMVNWAFLGIYFYYKLKSLKDDYSISESKEDGKWLLWTTMSFFFANVAVGLITLIIQGDQTLPKRQSSENFTSNDQEEPPKSLESVPSNAKKTPPREQVSENVSHDTRRNLIEQHSPDSGSNSPDRQQAHRRMLIVLASDSDHSVGQRQSNHSDSSPHTKIEPLTVGTTKQNNN